MSGAAKSLLDGAIILTLDPNEIDVSDRIGFYHPDKGVAIGRLIAGDGQRDAIKVSRSKPGATLPWRLHVGLDRTMGARLEGLPIYAIEVSGKPEDLVDLEASENLHRRPLGPIERAKFTAALVRAAQERIARAHGTLSHQKLGAKARWERVKAGENTVDNALRDDTEDACATMAQAYGWEESVGEALDMSRRTIHRDLSLSRLLIEPFPDLIEPLSKHPVVGENASQLKAICQVKDEAARRAVIEALLADTELSADEARVLAGIDRPDAGAKPAADQVLLNRVTATLARMRDADREATVEGLVLNERAPVKRRIFERLKLELGASAPTKVPMAQASSALSEAIRVMNALLSGKGVDDAQLEQLRRDAQAVVFDIPEQDGPSTGSGRTGGEA